MGGSRKLLAPIMTRLPAFSDGSIIILERHGRDLVDDEDYDPNTLLVRPYVEDIWGTWAWDVPIDKQMNDLQERWVVAHTRVTKLFGTKANL